MTIPRVVWSTSGRDRDTKIGDRTVTVNRLAVRTGRGGLVAHVSVLVEAIARGDRWAVARRATGHCWSSCCRVITATRSERHRNPIDPWVWSERRWW